MSDHSQETNLYLLGIYEANGHLSIRNYFEYCVAELPPFLPGWRISSSKPEEHKTNSVSHALTGKYESWRENYLRWPLKLCSLRSDIFHIVDQGIAWYRPFLHGRRTVITVHDLINMMLMNGHLDLTGVSRLHELKMRFCVQQIQKADAIICVSSNTADCVRRELKIPSSRIHVIHNIIGSEFRPAGPTERDEIRSKIFPETEYLILHVGKPSNYKNRVGVIETFKRVKNKLPGCKLALTASPLTEAERAILADIPSAVADVSIHLLETREQVRELYCAADLLIFPSLYEGFGWPPIEAMACDCPVISSPCGSLREIMGNTGLIVEDPHDHAAFADAAIEILLNPSLRRELIAKGKSNTSRFAKSVVFPKLAEIYQHLIE